MDSWQVDREDASPVGEVPRIDPSIVRFRTPSAEGETKADTGAIRAALLERKKQLVDISARQTAALVLDLDEHALGTRANPERDGRLRPGELEGVLEKVPNDRRQDLSVGLDRHAVFHRTYRQPDPTSVRIQGRGRCDFFDEPGDQELLSVLNALCETDFGERTSNKRV